MSGPYRIQVVAEMTGVPEPTLRAWERRYGVPVPERTAAGYRLYCDRDLFQVREMRRLCEEGMAAAEAARLVLAHQGGDGNQSSDREPARDGYALATSALLDAVERLDDVAIDAQLRRLLFLGTPGSLLERVVLPAMKAVGERWHAGRISVAHEHLASERLGTFLRDLVRLTPGGDGSARVVLAAFADEHHELGLLATALRCSTWGLRPLYLGARTPPEAVGEAVRSVNPALVALSCSVAPPAARGRALVDGYARACGKVPWLVGGPGAEGLRERIGALGGHMDPGSTEELEALVQSLLRPRSSGKLRVGDRGASRRQTAKKAAQR